MSPLQHVRMYSICAKFLTHISGDRIYRLFLILFLFIAGGIFRASADAEKIDEKGFKKYRNSSIKELRDAGMAYFNAGKLDSASMVLTIATSQEEGRKSEDELSLLAQSHNILGVINFMNSNYAGAYRHFLRGIELFDVPDAPGYANLAAIYLYYGDTPRAYECLRKVFTGAMERQHTYHAALALVNILTLDLNDAMIPSDSVRSLISTLRTIPPDLRDTRGYPVADSMAEAYLLSNSGRHMESARKLKGLLGNLGRMVLPARDIHSVYTLIAREYGFANMPDSAMRYLDKAQNIAAVNGFKELLAATYGEKSILLAETGREKEAESYRIMRLELNDSLFNPRELGKIRDIQMSYQTDAFEKKLEVMKVKEHMWKIIFIICAAALLVVSGILVLLYRKNKAIRDKNLYLFSRKTRDIIGKQPLPADFHVAPVDDTSSATVSTDKDVQIPDSPTLPEADTTHITANAGKDTDRDTDTISETDENRRKYTSSSLSDETRREILERIKRVFENESLFCQENFSLQTLAQLCDTNQRYASQIINENMGMNFASLLNEKRVNVACSRLMDVEKYGNLTIEAIISDLGFKSRSTFSKTFKRLTGLTPGEFQRLARQK